MKIDGKAIANIIIAHLKKNIPKLAKKPALSIVQVNSSPESASFVKIKEKTTLKIKAKFEIIRYRKISDFEGFANKIKTTAYNEKITAVVIQQPLPSSLTTESLYNFIPLEKEIEGHKKKSPFTPPIALAVLTILKYIYRPGGKKTFDEVNFNMKKDKQFLRNILKRKKIVLIGRGATGGKPIAKVLNSLNINFINIHSKTPTPEFFYKEADIIISAVGKKVLTPEVVKPGVILISVGVRQENGKWKGDYDEREIKNIASFYTPVPGGIGPLDIVYLMCNLVEATKMQV